MRYKTFGRKTGTACVGIRTRDRKLQHVRGWRWEWKPPVRYSMPLVLRVVRRSTCPISTKTDRQKLSLGELLGQDRGDYVVNHQVQRYERRSDLAPRTTGHVTAARTMIRSLEG